MNSIFEIVALLVQWAPKIKSYIDIGIPIIDELQKTNPKLIPILEKIGGELFPALKDTISKVAAAADAIFNPHGVEWMQRTLNTLQDAKLTVDGSYGPATKAAVTKFQEAHQPQAGAVDGWAGRMTQAVMQAELAKIGQ